MLDSSSQSSSSAPNPESQSSSSSPNPYSLPSSPPGSDDEAPDDDFAAHYLLPSEGEEKLMGFPPRS
eukprot:2530383-Pleurochrysis_carterae.AAC.1